MPGNNNILVMVLLHEIVTVVKIHSLHESIFNNYSYSVAT